MNRFGHETVRLLEVLEAANDCTRVGELVLRPCASSSQEFPSAWATGLQASRPETAQPPHTCRRIFLRRHDAKALQRVLGILRVLTKAPPAAAGGGGAARGAAWAPPTKAAPGRFGFANVGS